MQNIGIKLFDGTLYAVGDIYSMQGAEVVITTVADNQRIAEVELYLMDEKMPASSAFIGKFTIRDIPEAKAGTPRFSLIIKADRVSNLNVTVYDKGKLSGKMDIPSSVWHPVHKTDTAPQVIMEKKDKEHKRDFEVSFKGQKDTPKPETLAKPVLPTVPKEETTHYIPKEEDDEEPRYPVTGIVIGVVVVLVVIGFAALMITKPWERLSSNAGNGPTASQTEPVEATDESASSSIAEATIESIALPTPEPAAETPVPTIDPQTILASVNAKIDSMGAIYFEPDTAIIRPDSISKIELLAAVLSENKGLVRVTLTGHTARIGTTGEQNELSVERAKVIADAMIERNAIERDAIGFQGVGATKPATTDARRIELNRRVEIIVSLM